MQSRAALPVSISVMFTTLLLVYCTLFRVNPIPVVHDKHTNHALHQISFCYNYDSTKCSTECSHMSKSRQTLFLCGDTESAYNTVVVKSKNCWLCGSKYGFWYTLTNQLALFPSSPAQTSNSGNKVRFALGVALPDTFEY